MPDINLKPYSLRIAHLALVLVALPFVANSNELNGYMMSIQANAPGIEHLRAGDYRKAIAASRSVLSNPDWKVAAQNNICVSYTILKDYERASRSCARVIRVLRMAKSRQRRSKREDTTSLAMAYSNRGVLRALTDDLRGAGRDFVKAQMYATNPQKYEHNDALLQWNLSINGVDTRVSAK